VQKLVIIKKAKNKNEYNWQPFFLFAIDKTMYTCMYVVSRYAVNNKKEIPHKDTVYHNHLMRCHSLIASASEHSLHEIIAYDYQ